MIPITHRSGRTTPGSLLIPRILAALLALLGILSPSQVSAVETQIITSNLLSRGNGSYTTFDDQASAMLPIGFTFKYGGVDYTQASMSINGILFFANQHGGYTNGNLPGQSIGVYALWDDLFLGTGGNEDLTRILYTTTGEVGSRTFIAQWTNSYSFGETFEVGTFNVVLYEGSNKIDIYYRNMLGASATRQYGNSATIGLSTGPSYSSEYSFNSPVAVEGKLLTYTPTDNGFDPYTLTEQLVTPATTAAIPTYYLSHIGNPKLPTNLSSAPGTPNVTSATISWDVSELGATPTHFRIRYATNPELTGLIETADIPASPFVLNGLTQGATYYYQVVSFEGSSSSNSTVSQFIQTPNEVPVAANGSFVTQLGVDYNGFLSATDADNTPNTSGLIYSITTQGAHGTAVITDSATGAYTYTPAPGYGGPDSFVFKAFDGTAFSNEGTISVTVLATPSGPAAVADAVTSTSGPSTVYPLANDGDPNTIIVSVNNSAITIAADGRSVIVPEGFSGPFTYYASGGGTFAIGEVTVLSGTPLANATTYNGLLRDTNGAVVGWARAAVSSRGYASVQARVGANSASGKFSFDATTGIGTGTLLLGDVTITRNANGTLTFTIIAAGNTLGGNLRPIVTSPIAEKHHVALASIDAAIPGGGFVVMNISARGAAKVAGTMPDGRPFSASSGISDNGTVSIYGLQKSGLTVPAVIGGEFVKADLPKTDVTGELFWDKPAQLLGAKGMHLGGVDTVLVANGCRYNGVVPHTGAGTVTFSGSTFASPLDIAVNVTAGIPVVPNDALIAWGGVRASVGKFRARIKLPGIIRPVTGGGVYLPKSNSAWGYFPGITTGGTVELTIP